MSLKNRLLRSQIELSEDEAEWLGTPHSEGYTFEVHPPWDRDIPATLESVVKKMLEMQTKWLKRNVSPVTCFEIRRFRRDRVRFQFTVPTQRLMRKLRTGLATAMPDIRFGSGVSGIPVGEEESLGGGLLSLGRSDCFPLRTDFKSPPVNDVVSTLHPDAMQRTGILIQFLFKPVAGRPVRRWLWRRKAYRRRNDLRRNKASLTDTRNSTPREKSQADRVEEKAGSARFQTGIRFLVTGADDYTVSRVKELSGGFNRFESSVTGQYLNTSTFQNFRRKPFLKYAASIRDRQFDSWNMKFQVSVPELAALLSLPSIKQSNIRFAKP